jgi:hypothetical protein
MILNHATISPSDAADHLAIRELVEAYAHCADRRDAKAQMSLFIADTHFVVYTNAKDIKQMREQSGGSTCVNLSTTCWQIGLQQKRIVQALTMSGIV